MCLCHGPIEAYFFRYIPKNQALMTDQMFFFGGESKMHSDKSKYCFRGINTALLNDLIVNSTNQNAFWKDFPSCGVTFVLPPISRGENGG